MAPGFGVNATGPGGKHAPSKYKLPKGPKVASKMEALGLATPAAAKAPHPGNEASEEAKRKFLRIDSFEGTFDFLALDSSFQAGWGGTLFPTTRHALMAAQFPAASEEILKAASVSAATKAAEGESEIDEWQGKRLKVLENILRDKFRRHADLRKRLGETGDRDLSWENDEDGFWGTVKGKGQNQLGKLLMEIRTNVQDETEFDMWLHVCCELEDQEVKRPPVELVETKTGEAGAVEQKKVHRLGGKSYFKLGKLPTSCVVALHPSISREHALLIHTRSAIGRASQGVVLVDMGSKSGVSIGDQKVDHAWLMQPVRGGDIIRLGASTRLLQVKIDLGSQIALLEQQERELRREANAIDNDAANPLEAAKRLAKEESTVFIGNLEFETEKADLLGLFQDCGHIEECRFPGPEGTMTATKGICFVVFDSTMAARRACGLTGELFKGRKVKVSPASENRRAGGDKGSGGKGKDGKDIGKGKGGGKGDGKRDKDDDRGRGGGGGGGGGKGDGPAEDSRALFAEERRVAEAAARFRNRPRSGSRRRRSASPAQRRGGHSRRSPSRSKSAQPPARRSQQERSRSRDGEPETAREPARRSRRERSRSNNAAERSRSGGRRRKATRSGSPSQDRQDKTEKRRKR